MNIFKTEKGNAIITVKLKLKKSNIIAVAHFRLPNGII